LIVGLAELPESNSPSVIFFSGIGGFGNSGGGVLSATFGASGGGVFTTGASTFGVGMTGAGSGIFGASCNSANIRGGGGGSGFTISGFSRVGAISTTDSWAGGAICTSRGNQTANLIRTKIAAT
jgi:hypothetical protein